MKLFKLVDYGAYDSFDEAGLYDVCEWWIENYPDDIFINEPKEVVEIRKLMQKILEKRKK